MNMDGLDVVYEMIQFVLPILTVSVKVGALEVPEGVASHVRDEDALPAMPSTKNY